MDIPAPAPRASVRITEAEIRRRMGYHQSRGEGQVRLFEGVREAYIGVMLHLVDVVPQDTPERVRDLTATLDKTEEAMRQAIATIVCNGVGGDPEPESAARAAQS